MALVHDLGLIGNAVIHASRSASTAPAGLTKTAPAAPAVGPLLDDIVPASALRYHSSLFRAPTAPLPEAPLRGADDIDGFEVVRRGPTPAPLPPPLECRCRIGRPRVLPRHRHRPTVR